MKKTAARRRPPSGAAGGHCRLLIRKLSDLLDGELDAPTHRAMKKHLRECLPCLSMYRSLAWSVEALRRYPSVPVPGRVRDRLRREINRTFGGR